MVQQDRPNLWRAAREDDVETLDYLLGSDGGNGVDDLDDFGRTPLHVAVTGGSEKVVRYLIAAGADVNALDRESEWSPLHRALYLGHLRIALLLLRAGALLGDELAPWTKGRRAEPAAPMDADGHSPISLLSLMLKDSLKYGPKAVGGEVFSFGKADFPLGYVLPNTADVHKPRRVETLTHLNVVSVAAARHHSVALTRSGHVYTWGHGRGGRLGHGDENVRMFPERVESLRNIAVAKVSASDGHSAIITTQGVVFTWGSDSFGQLGLGGSGGDKASSTRLVPRRVEALRRMVVVDISAGPTHTAAVTSSGEVYTWGGNKAGQLGYEPLSAVGDGIPRMVNMLFHRQVGRDPRRAIQVSAGPRCTLVIVMPNNPAPPGNYTPDVNKVYQFGYGSCVPMRVDFRPAESSQAHKAFWGIGCRDSLAGRINIKQVAAALHHNVALGYNGRVYAWGLGRDQLGLEEGQVSFPVLVSGISSGNRGLDHAVYISASAEHTCVVTDLGDLYTWGTTDDQGILGHGPGRWQPVPKRVKGLKRVTRVAAGPEHTIVLLSPFCPPLPYSDEVSCSTHFNPLAIHAAPDPDEIFTMDEEEAAAGTLTPPAPAEAPAAGTVMTLKQICERVIAAHCDMKNAVSVLAHAEVLDSPALASYALDFMMQNLDGILVLGRPADLDFLLEDQADGINRMIQERQQQLAIASSPMMEEEMGMSMPSPSSSPSTGNTLTSAATTLINKISKGREPSLEEAVKWERGLKKRMAQIEDLEKAQAQGAILTVDQKAKLSRKENVRKEMATLEPVLRRLRFVHSARLARAGSSVTKEEKREEEEVVAVQEVPEEGIGMMVEEEEKPFGIRVCDICNVTCTSQEGWDEHIMGKRHKKRMANIEASKPSPSPTSQVTAPWLKKPVTTSESPLPLEESPLTATSVNSNPSLSATTTPAKSFREILEEEEREAARQRSSHNFLSFKSSTRGVGPSPKKATPEFVPFSLQPLGSQHLATSPSPSLGIPQPPTATLLSRATPPSPSPILSGGVLLSDFLKANKTPVKKAVTPKACAGPIAPWVKKTPEPAVDHPRTPDDVDLISSSPAQIKDIMKEEEDKVVQNRRFSGNNSVWFVEPRQRTNSFDVIQTEQELEAIQLQFERLERERLLQAEKEKEKEIEVAKEKERKKAKAKSRSKSEDRTKGTDDQGGKKKRSEGPVRDRAANKEKGKAGPPMGTTEPGPGGDRQQGDKDRARDKRKEGRRDKPKGRSSQASEACVAPPVGDLTSHQPDKKSRKPRPKASIVYIPKASGTSMVPPVEGVQQPRQKEE